MTGVMSIGRLGAETGVNIETIRYYERIGLLPEPARTAAGYRQYGPEHLHRLSFIRRGRDLGFQINDIRALLDLAARPDQRCEEADRRARAHLSDVERKIEELERLRDALRGMIDCHADSVADCRIIEALAS